VPVGELVAPPDDLSPEAGVIWHRVFREFGHTGVIRGVDGDVLRLYCETVVRYQKASALLDASGPLVKGARNGEVVKNPLHQIVRDNATMVRALAGELGMTPAARVGMRDANERQSSATTVLQRLQSRRSARPLKARGA
jgi:P27 family predicted phage terminase small subunit